MIVAPSMSEKERAIYTESGAVGKLYFPVLFWIAARSIVALPSRLCVFARNMLFLSRAKTRRREG
jgi:hypothetical protein